MKNSNKIYRMLLFIFNSISTFLYGGKSGIVPKETKW